MSENPLFTNLRNRLASTAVTVMAAYHYPVTLAIFDFSTNHEARVKYIESYIDGLTSGEMFINPILLWGFWCSVFPFCSELYDGAVKRMLARIKRWRDEKLDTDIKKSKTNQGNLLVSEVREYLGAIEEVEWIKRAQGSRKDVIEVRKAELEKLAKSLGQVKECLSDFKGQAAPTRARNKTITRSAALSIGGREE